MAARVNISLGDEVMLKKPHPCGCNVWVVKRVGMDIKLECSGCHHVVTMDRASFEKRYRGHVSGQSSDSPDVGGEK